MNCGTISDIYSKVLHIPPNMVGLLFISRFMKYFWSLIINSHFRKIM